MRDSQTQTLIRKHEFPGKKITIVYSYVQSRKWFVYFFYSYSGLSGAESIPSMPEGRKQGNSRQSITEQTHIWAIYKFNFTWQATISSTARGKTLTRVGLCVLGFRFCFWHCSFFVWKGIEILVVLSQKVKQNLILNLSLLPSRPLAVLPYANTLAG